MTHSDASKAKIVFAGAKPLPLFFSALVGIAIWFLPHPESVDPRAWHLLAIFASLISGLIGKALPIGGISFVALTVVALTQTLSLKEAFSGFSHPVIWLVVSAFLISRSIIKTGLGMRIAYLFVSLLGKNSLGLSYGVCATELILAPVIPSSTARAGGIVYPIVKALSLNFDSDPAKHSQRLIGSFLIMVAYYGNIITSAMFVTAIAVNPLISVTLQDAGIPISWGQWFAAALLPGAISLICMPYLLYRFYPPELRETPEARRIARHHLEEMGPLSFYEKITLAVFGMLVLLWVFGEGYGLDSTTVALLGVSTLLISGVLTWDDIKRESEAWDTLIWFSTLLMMATYLNQLGLIAWVSSNIQIALTGMSWWLAWPLLSMAYFYSHYLFAGNTSHVTSMFAAFLSVGIALEAPPYLIALSLAYISSLFACLTHYGTGCAPVLFGSEYVNIKNWWRLGAMMSVFFLVVWLGLGSLWWKLLGFW